MRGFHGESEHYDIFIVHTKVLMSIVQVLGPPNKRLFFFVGALANEVRWLEIFIKPELA
tara:strand:- start:2019 stop:2195 length:177 start_codon:yes stop_codon:yes gene_type:complete